MPPSPSSPRWLFHVLRAADVGWGSDGRYRPASLSTESGGEGFVHASYRDVVLESARLYFRDPPEALRVLAIDPRRLDVPVIVEQTPRGPMPHIFGAIPGDAVRVLSLGEVEAHPDRVTGTRIGVASFRGMTLLDLVGPLDVLSRIASMGFDPSSSCEVFALTRPANDPNVAAVEVWRDCGGALFAGRFRPALDEFDVLVVPGGPSTQELERDPEVASYLASFPDSRLFASVCTGALLAGVAGRLRGRRATTHASAVARLADFGATFVDQRVVDEGSLVTAGGVTAGIDLGLHLVRRLVGEEAATAIATRIEWREASEAGERAGK